MRRSPGRYAYVTTSFHYKAVCICGIPAVMLEGTPDDWERITEKVESLHDFDLDWWLPHLRPICEQFVRASRGKPDIKHWQRICKLSEAYGGDIINGWVAKLFPYLLSFIGGPCNKRNPIFETGEGFNTLFAPTGLSRVPFTWRNTTTGRVRAMEAIGGLVGVTQEAETLALRPAVGWAVREAEKQETQLTQLVSEHTTFAGVDLARRDSRGWEMETGLPSDLSNFYHRTNGAELFGRGEQAAFRIVPVEAIEPLDWGEPPAQDENSYSPSNFLPRLVLPGTASPKESGESFRLSGRNWHRFVNLADGSWLAINLDRSAPDPRPKSSRRYDPLFHAICHCRSETQGKSGQNPVVALSFTELLERLLDSGGKPFWLDPRFTGYGDAELFTRRD